MTNQEKLVRFDWAMKRLLRNKADYCVVEGLLTVLLGKPIHIESLLESESNQESEEDKFNRVDILAGGEDGELMIFEIQNNRELDYFHRMAYGTSKAMSEYLKIGSPYEGIRKIYSIHIVYFTIGQGNDYVYKGTTQFVGLHDSSDILRLSKSQRDAFNCETPADIFPEYYLLRVDKFNAIARTPLDEWISFLKSGEIPADATAPGLQEARERLRVESLNDAELRSYYHRLDNQRYQRSVIETGRFEGRMEGREEGLAAGKEIGHAEGMAEGRKAGRKEGAVQANIEAARRLKRAGISVGIISQCTGLGIDQISKL